MKIIAPCFTNNKGYANPLVNCLNKYSPEYSDSLILYTDGTTSTDFYHTKMFHAAQAMKNIDDEIVILVDAFDVLVNKSLKNIEEDFKKHECKLLIFCSTLEHTPLGLVSTVIDGSLYGNRFLIAWTIKSFAAPNVATDSVTSPSK